MNLSEYFDPHNMVHVQAWKFLCEHGMWPPAFWNEIDSMTIDNGWQIAVAAKMADAWVKHMLGEEQ